MSHASHHAAALAVCPNCGTDLRLHGAEAPPVAFCPTCGQPNHDLNVSFGHIVEETLEGVLHFDSKVWLTFKELLFYPGKLTVDFLAGRRAAFVPPIRLYVFISVVFFFLLAHQKESMEINFGTATPASIKAAEEEREATAPHSNTAPPAAAPDSATSRKSEFRGIKMNGEGVQYQLGGSKGARLTGADLLNKKLMHRLAAGNRETADSLLRAQGVKVSWANRLMLRRIARTAETPKEEIEHTTMKNVSLGMFLLMPLFALLVKAFYRRQRPFYMHHLIFSIHLHCFFFLLFSFGILLEYAVPESWDLGGVVLLGAWVYWVVALKRFSGQGWGRTIGKSALLFGAYSMLLAVFAVGIVIISLSMI